MSEIALGSLNCIEICSAPRSRKTIKNDVSTITIGLNLASHETIIAVKPRPPTVLVPIVWPVPATNKSPAIPQRAPDMISVLIITFLTFIPMYLAVFSLSPTTEIS